MDRDADGAVSHVVHLARGCFQDPGVTMPDIGDPNPRGEIQVAAPIRGIQVSPLRLDNRQLGPVFCQAGSQYIGHAFHHIEELLVDLHLLTLPTRKFCLPYTLSIDQNNPDITWLIITRGDVKNKVREWFDLPLIEMTSMHNYSTMNTIAVSLGDGCIDHYLSPIEKDFIGGNALNVAVHMQRAGLPCAFVGYVGGEQYGERIKQALHEEGIDGSHVQTTAGPTKKANIRLSGDNEPIFIHDQHVPITQLRLDDTTLAFILQHRLVHTSWLGGAQAYLNAIAGTPLLVSIDYGEGRNAAFIEETLSLANVAFYSMPEGTEEQARLRAQELGCGGPGLVVVTRGSQGSLACLSGEFYTQTAYPVTVVDTLGAGDAFIGTFLAGWLMGLGVADCLEQASRAAAFTCTHHGSWYGAEVI